MTATLVPAWEMPGSNPFYHHAITLFYLHDLLLKDVLSQSKEIRTTGPHGRVGSGAEVMSIAPLFAQELPERWETTKKIAATVRHEVSPLQNAEVTLIRKRCILFDVS